LLPTHQPTHHTPCATHYKVGCVKSATPTIDSAFRWEAHGPAPSGVNTFEAEPHLLLVQPCCEAENFSLGCLKTGRRQGTQVMQRMLFPLSRTMGCGAVAIAHPLPCSACAHRQPANPEQVLCRRQNQEESDPQNCTVLRHCGQESAILWRWASAITSN